MSMFYCRGCGKEIHESAETCPSCGAPQKVVAAGGNKSKVVAALLALFLGALGIHRFYLGQWWGLFYLLLCWTGIPSLISFIEAIVFLLSNQQNWDNKFNDGVNSGESSGVAVVLLLIVILFGGVVVIGILAAIALPAYQDYTIKSQATSALAEVVPGKVGFELAVYERVTPTTDSTSAGFIGITATGGTYCDISLTAPTSTAAGTLVCTIKNANPLITSKVITLSRSSDGIWSCTTDITATIHYPGSCTTAAP